MMCAEIDRARDALNTIPPDLSRDDWVKVAMAAHAAGLDFETFNDWSAQAGSYAPAAARDVWKSIKPGKGIGAGTLFRMAGDHGWRANGQEANPTPVAPARQSPPPKPQRPRSPGMSPAEVWRRGQPATYAQPYIVDKAATGVPLDLLRVVPEGDPLVIAGEPMAGALIVPCLHQDGTLSSAQIIAPPETAERLKAKGKPGKLNLPGASLVGCHMVGNLEPAGVVYVCEGIGQAWACWQATGRAAAVAFGWGRVRSVAEFLRQKDRTLRMVLVPDVGKESKAAEIAAAIKCDFVTMPIGWPDNSDVNDLAQREGLDVLEVLLSRPQAAKPGPLALGTVFADELPDSYIPPDEIVQGVLTAGAGSMLYGDSNSGKTFFTIDLACAVARGVPWMGRRTESGLVVYVAAESPASVRSRLQAYQQHHGCKVPNFAIVQQSLDLFKGDSDTDALIALVRTIERQRGHKVRLIVGDTLARLSAGANENSGEDMGMVVCRFDRVRTECDAHFLMIHHSGKAAASGARGWSGIKAAMDTEIEVTDALTGRCAEITKQRDIGTKGERIGFILTTVMLGRTKWGDPATTCVVEPTEAPSKERKATKRMGAVEGAVLEYLRGQLTGVNRAKVVKHFDGQYPRTSVYRAIVALGEAGMAHIAQESNSVCIAEAAR